MEQWSEMGKEIMWKIIPQRIEGEKLALAFFIFARDVRAQHERVESIIHFRYAFMIRTKRKM